MASLAQRTGKRTAAHIVHTSCKKRSGSTIVRGESVAVEEYQDSDGTVVDGAGKTSSVEVDNKRGAVADEKSDSVDEEKVQDNEGAESPIQELQDLSEASGVAAQKGLHKCKEVPFSELQSSSDSREATVKPCKHHSTQRILKSRYQLCLLEDACHVLPMCKTMDIYLYAKLNAFRHSCVHFFYCRT